MKNSPKILILGFGSVMNYGGEAIVQGTCKLLTEIWPNARITIATKDIESAKRVLTDYKNITFVLDKPRFTFKRIAKGLLRRFGLGKGEPLHYNYRLVDNHDIFLSVGGDIFVQNTSGRISTEVIDLMNMGYRAKKQGKVYCLWGASVGPFDNPYYFEKVAENLRIADLITVREEKGLSYLKSMGCGSNVVKVGDPAFIMEPKTSDFKIRTNDDEILIGINFSQLAMNHVFGEQHTHEDFLSVVNSINVLGTLGENIKLVLIPHVMSSHGGAQDDYLFLSKIKECLTIDPARVVMLPNQLGSQKTKFLMQQCDIVIAARMHCFVGSVSVGTPAIMIAYSDKGYGMARYAYGSDEWVIGLEKLKEENSLTEKVTAMLQQKEVLRQELSLKRELWKNDARIAAQSLKKVYEKKEL